MAIKLIFMEKKLINLTNFSKCNKYRHLNMARNGEKGKDLKQKSQQCSPKDEIRTMELPPVEDKAAAWRITWQLLFSSREGARNLIWPTFWCIKFSRSRRFMTCWQSRTRLGCQDTFPRASLGSAVHPVQLHASDYGIIFSFLTSLHFFFVFCFVLFVMIYDRIL